MLTANVEDAARLGQQLTPSAILVAVDRNKASETKSVPALRRRLPTVPIVAVVSRQQFGTPGRFFDQGADALLMRDDAHRPTLHDLLVSVQLDPDVAKTATRIHAPIPGFPWRRSEMLGALICDVTGLIVDANRLLATWLGYPNTDELRGKNVLHDFFKSRDDWISWKQVAGDTSAKSHHESAVAAKKGQVLWTTIEVFAAPSHSRHLQAVFIDLTELAMLAGRENIVSVKKRGRSANS